MTQHYHPKYFEIFHFYIHCQCYPSILSKLPRLSKLPLFTVHFIFLGIFTLWSYANANLITANSRVTSILFDVRLLFLSFELHILPVCWREVEQFIREDPKLPVIFSIEKNLRPVIFSIDIVIHPVIFLMKKCICPVISRHGVVDLGVWRPGGLGTSHPLFVRRKLRSAFWRELRWIWIWWLR